jgi:gamma-glutamylaminecyclotransferase
VSTPHGGQGEQRVFVYGTLLSGEGNHRNLDGAKFLGEARTAALYTLVDLGYFPALLERGTTAVRGQVFLVDAKTLARLDWLEGHPRFYERVRVTLSDGDEVEGYVLAEGKATRAKFISTGCWRTHRQEVQR